MKAFNIKMWKRLLMFVLAVTIFLQAGAAYTKADAASADTDSRMAEVQERLDRLPDVMELAAMNEEEQADVYTEACDIADIYYDELTEEQQRELDTVNWIAILDFFANPDPAYLLPDNPDGITIDKALGCTTTIESWLSQHTNDNYYLGTPYPHTSNAHNIEGMTMSPLGDITPGYSAGMNCTGFVAHVLEKCGGNLNLIREATRDKWNGLYVATNLSGWYRWIDGSNLLCYRYNSISELLASGKLQKGDIILFEPRNWSVSTDIYGNGIDNHIGIFWGSSPSENKWWHSSHPVNGMGGDNLFDGNQISAIVPKFADCYVYLFPVQHNGYGGVGKKDSQTGEIVAGATYYVYSDKACTTYANDINGSHTMITTTTYPYVQKLLTYKPGKYYVKEATAPAGYALNSDVLTLTVEAGKTSWATVSGAATGWNYDIPIGNAYIKKVSSANFNTVVGGAEYTVYKDKACTVIAKDINGKNAVFTTAVDGSGSNLITFECGTYYVKETKAADHYSLSNEVYTLTVARGKNCTVAGGTVSDPPKAQVYLQKKTGNPSVTLDNHCYSLAGAVYGIYSDLECTILAAQLTTDESGMTETAELDAGVYFVQEITASPGYQLSDEVLEINLQPGERKSFFMDEIPVTDEFNLRIMKGDAETEKFCAQGAASLEGAIFEVDYYDNTNGDSSGAASRVWYFSTDESGELYCGDAGYLTDSYVLNDGTELISNDLYYDSEGTIIYPLGTYKIKEVSPPKYYRLSGSMCFVGDQYNTVSVVDGLTAVISEKDDKAVIQTGSGKDIAGTNPAIAAYDEIYKGFVTVQKYDSDGTTPLQGAGFKLVGAETGEVYTGITDVEGKLVFDNLIPQRYTLTETSTVEGHTLLKDSMEITLPMEMTMDEIRDCDADINKAVWDEAAQAYCFYDLTYRVTNEAVFDIPMTGGNTKMLYAGVAAAFGFVCAGLFLAFGFRRKKMQAVL